MILSQSEVVTKIVLAVPESHVEFLLLTAADLTRQYPTFQHVSLAGSHGEHKSTVALYFAESLSNWPGDRLTKLKITVADLLGLNVGVIKLCFVGKG